MITEPRNYFLKNAEINWAKLDRPVNPFGTEQWELQAATTDKSVADEWTANYLNVKEKDGKYTVSLKRKAYKADGSAMEPVKVFNGDMSDFSDKGSIGNGSVGNIKVFQFPYEQRGQKGISSSLTAVQLVKLEKYESNAATGGFEVIESATAEAAAESSADLF